jgi:DNA-binding response OmpR family regulator
MKYKILIIEDETETSKYLALALQDEGFDTICVENAEQAFKALRFNVIELVVLDLKLPTMNGDGILEKIREMSDHIEIVVYTNNNPAIAEMQKLINLGIDGFFKKDVNLNDIVAFIKSKFEPMEEHKRKELFSRIFQSGTPLSANQ